MFERFTDRARTVVILAKAKAVERGDQIRPVYMVQARQRVLDELRHAPA